tara:strand:- start:1266 stop:1778 length:513 start_codon:yes stop_codon:yes gene_type:complete
MSRRNYRERNKLAVFFSNLWVVLQERMSTVWVCISVEWEYAVIRARIWRGYKELDAARYDRETGQFQSLIDPQDLNQGELHLNVIKTMKLRRLADRFHIQMPDEHEPGNYGTISWDDDRREPKYLTAEGLRKLLPLIRAAQKERRDAAGFWFGVIVGVIGALTGLVSVLN